MTPNQKPEWIKNLEKAVNLIVKQKLQDQAQEILGEIEEKLKHLIRKGAPSEQQEHPIRYVVKIWSGIHDILEDLESSKNKIKEKYGTK